MARAGVGSAAAGASRSDTWDGYPPRATGCSADRATTALRSCVVLSGDATPVRLRPQARLRRRAVHPWPRSSAARRSPARARAERDDRSCATTRTSSTATARRRGYAVLDVTAERCTARLRARRRHRPADRCRTARPSRSTPVAPGCNGCRPRTARRPRTAAHRGTSKTADPLALLERDCRFPRMQKLGRPGCGPADAGRSSGGRLHGRRRRRPRSPEAGNGPGSPRARIHGVRHTERARCSRSRRAGTVLVEAWTIGSSVRCWSATKANR